MNHTQPTMTELKTNGDKSINAVFPERMMPLIEELRKYDYKKLSFGSKLQFKKPFLFGGQNSNNQTGYGWEWEWGDCVYEGTLYGEVTNFLIVGFIYEDKWT